MAEADCGAEPETACRVGGTVRSHCGPAVEAIRAHLPLKVGSLGREQAPFWPFPKQKQQLDVKTRGVRESEVLHVGKPCRAYHLQSTPCVGLAFAAAAQCVSGLSGMFPRPGQEQANEGPLGQCWLGQAADIETSWKCYAPAHEVVDRAVVLAVKTVQDVSCET
jgi:hypothetical protein